MRRPRRRRSSDCCWSTGRRGREVVRLKGGDPFVFGRGGEEAEALREAGIAFEVVPGVTAGVAAPAYAGIPVTHRDAASAVAFVTGHEDPAKPESALDWEALAAFPGTLVIYMGVRQLEAIAQRLITAGRPATEPAAVIERGTLPDQRVVTGTLATIAGIAEQQGFEPRRSSLFGPVAALRTISSGSGRGRWRVRRSRSRAPGRRRAVWRRACAGWAPRWSRPRRSGSCRSRARRLSSSATTSCA